MKPPEISPFLRRVPAGLTVVGSICLLTTGCGTVTSRPTPNPDPIVARAPVKPRTLTLTVETRTNGVWRTVERRSVFPGDLKGTGVSLNEPAENRGSAFWYGVHLASTYAGTEPQLSLHVLTGVRVWAIPPGQPGTGSSKAVSEQDLAVAIGSPIVIPFNGAGIKGPGIPAEMRFTVGVAPKPGV